MSALAITITERGKRRVKPYGTVVLVAEVATAAQEAAFSNSAFWRTLSYRERMWTMKKLVFLAAFALAAIPVHQAAACDMGAIEAEVASTCQGATCPATAAAQQADKSCAADCTKLQGAAANVAPAMPLATPVACTGSNCGLH